MSQAYGKPGAKVLEKTLREALEVGYTFLDTASICGLGHNEALLGKPLKDQRDQYVLAPKCGIFNNDGKRGVDCRPETIKATCEKT